MICTASSGCIPRHSPIWICREYFEARRASRLLSLGIPLLSCSVKISFKFCLQDCSQDVKSVSIQLCNADFPSQFDQGVQHVLIFQEPTEASKAKTIFVMASAHLRCFTVVKKALLPGRAWKATSGPFAWCGTATFSMLSKDRKFLIPDSRLRPRDNDVADLQNCNFQLGKVSVTKCYITLQASGTKHCKAHQLL